MKTAMQILGTALLLMLVCAMFMVRCTMEKYPTSGVDKKHCSTDFGIQQYDWETDGQIDWHDQTHLWLCAVGKKHCLLMEDILTDEVSIDCSKQRP